MRADIPYRDQVNVGMIRAYAYAVRPLSERIAFTLGVIANYAEGQGDIALERDRRLQPFLQAERMQYFLDHFKTESEG